MTREELKDGIAQNMRHQDLEVEQIRVQPDPFAGWRVVVISKDFEGRARQDRAALAFAGLDEAQIQWSELLTPSELEWSGPLFVDSELSGSPSWMNAFERASASAQTPEPAADILFPSDLDTDLPTPISVTFYSVRGGVGRSTALGYCGRILAARGRRVICVDLDLEAPGLASLFGVESQVSEDQGVVHLLVALDKGEEPDVSKHLIRVTESSELYCLPAGQPSAEYARLLRLINPSAWYSEERNPLRNLLSALTDKLPFRPDVILFDARTGISEISAPLLFDLADIAVIVFFPHPQARRATKEVVRALLSSRTRRNIGNRKFAPEPRFLVSPIPSSRIPEVVQRYRNRSQDWIAEWMAPIGNGATGSISELVHFVPYKEDIATADSVLPSIDSWRDYEPVAEWIERFLPSDEDAEPPLPQNLKGRVLSELQFSAGTAEYQEDFLNTFVEAGLTARALSPATPLVVGRKGVGKTAIFRRLLERQDVPSIPITAPAPLRGGRPWVLTVDAFAEVESLLTQRGASWRQFWTVLTCLACHYGWPDQTRRPEPHPLIAPLLPAQLTGETSTVVLLDQLFSTPRVSLAASEWFAAFDRATDETLLLLFDALDTGFGNSEKERERRREAIEGLCALLIQQNDTVHIKLKVVLRQDIWGKLRFENKSHLFGRYVTLDWSDQTTFYKIVLKQALKSQTFTEVVQRAAKPVDINRLDEWTDREVVLGWNLLVGERMKGEKTAFTRNWVWNRLADANQDHTPRYLLQLFREVTRQERIEHQRTPYDRSILRPRAFIQALPAVSGQALDALKEEYPELDPLLERLRQIGRTPVASEELEDLTEALVLGREVGLIGIYEGTEDRVERYRVPEIYRYALGMTRKGQA